MSNNNLFNPESLLEQGISVVKKTGNVAAQQVKATVQTATSQITGDAAAGDAGGDVDAAAAKQTQDFVQELYGVKKPQQQQANASSHTPAPKPQQTQAQPQDASSQDKLAQTRQQLEQLKQQQHTREYYDPTFNRPKQEEETVVDKLDREKEEENFELQKKKAEKPQDLATQRANQRTEKFPGGGG